jgi:hypothetical protein
MFSRQYQYIFIHIPKTGGGSIKDELEALYGHGERRYAHETAAESRRMFGASLFESYYKWAVVRNPYDRFISAYYWRKHEMLRMGREAAAAVPIEDFALDIDKYAQCHGRHVFSQYDMTHINGKCVCDIYRYEQGLEEILRLATRKISQGTLVHNGTVKSRKHILPRDKRPYDEQLSEAAIDAITQRYQIDFITFGYDFHRK